MRALPLALVCLSACGSSRIETHTPDAAVSIVDGRVIDAPIVTGDGDAGPVVCITGLTSITLAPADSTITVNDGSTPAPISFAATGKLGNGDTRPIAASSLTWTVSRDDDTAPGTISGAGLLTPSPGSGGLLTVKATDGCITGTTTVKLVVNASEGTPPSGWTDAQVMMTTAPVIVYPSDQTLFPRNVYKTLFQWQAGGTGPFRLIFTGAGGTFTVYTDGNHAQCEEAKPAAGCWESDQRAWGFIAGSNAGQTATLTVDRLDTSGAQPIARRSAAITLGFSRRDVPGAIFYWSTTSKGIRRGSLYSDVPEDYIIGDPMTVLADGDKVHCVACHTLSRDGKYIAGRTESDQGKSLWVIEVTKEAPPKPLVKSIPNTQEHGFATFSPDDTYLVAAWNGKLTQLERVNGNKVADLNLGGLMGTHPDWSPDNSQLVFASGAKDAPDNAGLALMTYSGGTTWGTPKIFVASAGGKTNLFPQFSPEGAWIAFSRGDKGGHEDNSMQLLMVRAMMGAIPIVLTRASCTVSTSTDDCNTENYEPTWAPPGDLHWVAFNSKRKYGVVRPAGNTQIWIAAVDITKVEQGDPSYPAFRVPFQGLDESNHRAYWTQDIRQTTPGPDAGPDAPSRDGGACKMYMDVCDPSLDKCCDSQLVCETLDDGESYHCIARDPDQ